MAFSTVLSFSLDGLNAPPVLVETHLSNGLPSFALVGLPDTEVREARDRVRAAIVQSGFEFPRVRLTVNLAPADLPKESGRFDLPIALGILAASQQIPARALQHLAFAGELSLSGSLRPIRGALAMALAAAEQESQTLVLPAASAAEALLAGTGQAILSADTLGAVCRHLRGEDRLSPPDTPAISARAPWPDLADVKGQHRARRALEIADVGEHSLLMCGPPGSGKSMLAHRLPGLLPDLEPDAARRSAALLSLSNSFKPADFGVRPLRVPHHTASAVALVGGGCDFH